MSGLSGSPRPGVRFGHALLALALLAPLPTTLNLPGALAATTSPPLALSVEQERQAQRIGMKVGCPICSGESVAQSQNEISRQMMNEIRTGLRTGQSEAQILGRFEAAYGERILLEPPRRGVYWLLWTLPLAALGLGGAAWLRYLRRASRPVADLSAEDDARIQALLGERGGRA